MKIKTTVISLFTILFFTFNGLSTMAQSDCISKNKKFRETKNNWIETSPQTPFSPEMLQNFDGLNYFEIDCNYKLTGTYTPLGEAKMETMSLTDGTTVQIPEYGQVEFVLPDGTTHTLKVYKNMILEELVGNTYFIPFKDATSGDETFTGGRYLQVSPPEAGGSMILDFNQAINPYEAYSSNYSGLVVPSGNVMMAPIPTGERKNEDR